MKKMSLMIICVLALGACVDEENTNDTTIDEAGLANELSIVRDGKADNNRGDLNFLVRSNFIQLRGAPARTLYNLMNDAGSYERTGAGQRLLIGDQTACLTNGEESICRLYGKSRPLRGKAFAAKVQGDSARYLRDLLIDKTGINKKTVAIPWFSCTKGRSTFCKVERGENLSIKFDGAAPLGEDFVYEGWAVTKKFGATTTSRFADPTREIRQSIPRSLITKKPIYVLTIEPKRGDLSAPSKTHLLAGKLKKGEEIALDTAHPAALNTDFSSAKGRYLMATPTTKSKADNNQGIWFLDPRTKTPTLNLPELPEGWIYEGWVVGDKGPVSTGKFREVKGEDSDGAGASAGSEGFPPFPGQDFIHPKMVVEGTTIVISVEPVPDNSAAPFEIKPLIDMKAEKLGPPETQAMETLDNRPHGVVRLGAID